MAHFAESGQLFILPLPYLASGEESWQDPLLSGERGDLRGRD